MRLIDADKFKNILDNQKFMEHLIKVGLSNSQNLAFALAQIIDEQPTVEQNRMIPCSERMPECEQEVYITTKRGIVTTALYEDGKMAEDDSRWNWNDIDYNYDKENDINYIPEGWWEYRHFNQDDVYNNPVDEVVIAWMPLPEEYEEVSE